MVYKILKYNKILVFFKDRCLEKNSLEFRKFGQARRARTNLARANETHKTSPREFGVPAKPCVLWGSLYQHSVSEGEESIFFLDRLFVRVHSIIIPRKSANQHNKRTLGEMEIGNYRIDAFEFDAGVNKN